jgi:hypothetical protein
MLLLLLPRAAASGVCSIGKSFCRIDSITTILNLITSLWALSVVAIVIEIKSHLIH